MSVSVRSVALFPPEYMVPVILTVEVFVALNPASITNLSPANAATFAKFCAANAFPAAVVGHSLTTFVLFKSVPTRTSARVTKICNLKLATIDAVSDTPKIPDTVSVGFPALVNS